MINEAVMSYLLFIRPYLLICTSDPYLPSVIVRISKALTRDYFYIIANFFNSVNTFVEVI